MLPEKQKDLFRQELTILNSCNLVITISREDTAIFETPISLNHFPTANDWCVLKCGLNDIFLSAHNEAMRWIFALHFPSSISSTGLLIFIDSNLPLKIMLP